MFDNSLNFEPTFIDTGVQYTGWNVRPPYAVEDRNSCEDTHLAMLGVKRGNRHFGYYLRIEAALDAASFSLYKRG